MAGRDYFLKCEFIPTKKEVYLAITTYGKELVRYYGIQDISHFVKTLIAV